MAPMTPREKHAIEQYMALSIEVQVTLARHHAILVSEGVPEPEAWAMCQRVEERILGPAIGRAERIVIEENESIDDRIRRMLREERGARDG